MHTSWLFSDRFKVLFFGTAQQSAIRGQNTPLSCRADVTRLPLDQEKRLSLVLALQRENHGPRENATL
jgi:hypothetical protein